MTKPSSKRNLGNPRKAAASRQTRKLMPHEVLVSPTIQNAVGIEAWSAFAGKPDLAELLDDVREQVRRLHDGDMSSVEAMLYGQALSLQTIFTSLSRKAASSEYLKQFQANLGLALKAQAQCRATLEALAEIKNPRPVLITKQANISGGHQQVVNGAVPAPPGSLENSGFSASGDRAISHAATISPAVPASNAAKMVEAVPR